jgi:hypothetical protein
MRTAAAYISKLKSEALGRTYKVQDTNHRLFTSTLYRGAAGCGPVDYTQIDYVEVCKCDYIGTAPRPRHIPPPPPPPPPPPMPTILDGGSPFGSGFTLIDGGSPLISGPTVIDGGFP